MPRYTKVPRFYTYKQFIYEWLLLPIYSVETYLGTYTSSFTLTDKLVLSNFRFIKNTKETLYFKCKY